MTITDRSRLRDEPPRLSARSYGLCLLITLGLFFGLHPIWQDIDITRLDATIWWSYVPITFLIANTLWFFTDTPDLSAPTMPPPASTGSVGPFDVRPAPPSTPPDSAGTGWVDGSVRDAAGRPLSGVLVVVTAGLEGRAFQPPDEPLVLTISAVGRRLPSAIVQTHRVVVLRNDDDVLHAVQARDAGGRWLFTFPVVPHGRKSLMFRRARGSVSLGCDLPDHLEPDTSLFIVDHPFAQRTDADGRFAFAGLPAGEIVITSLVDREAAESLAVTVVSGARVGILLQR